MKGLILAGGYGSRFFPITKTIPKEMLPLIDRPIIDFIVEEMVLAGIEEILIVSSRRKSGLLEDYFDRDIELETFVKDPIKLSKLKDKSASLRVYFTRQKEMKGTGHAVLLGKGFLRGSFVLAFPDDIVLGGSGLSNQLILAHKKTSKSVLAVREVPFGDISRYGIVDPLASSADNKYGKDIIGTCGIVEKPKSGQEPSRLVSIGRYLLTDEILPILEDGIERHKEGEYYLTDALNLLSKKDRVVSCKFDGTLYDTGEPLSYMKSLTSYALAREDIRDEYLGFLNDLG